MRKADRLHVIILLVSISCSIYALGAVSERTSKWAAPIQLEGVPNLHKVTDNLYRSAQPTAEGMKNLAKLGLKHVISLRANHSDRTLLLGTDLALTEVKMRTWDVRNKEVIRVLRILKDPSGGPYLIHCQHGSDRTGLICAMYRIVFQNWTKEDAIREMVQGGYGFHKIWNNIVGYIKNADIDRFRKEISVSDIEFKIEPPVPKMTGRYRAARYRVPR